MRLWRWNRRAINHGWPIFGMESRNGGMTWLVLGHLPWRPKWKTLRVLPLPWEHDLWHEDELQGGDVDR